MAFSEKVTGSIIKVSELISIVAIKDQTKMLLSRGFFHEKRLKPRLAKLITEINTIFIRRNLIAVFGGSVRQGQLRLQ